jgi:hypothetical protein
VKKRSNKKTNGATWGKIGERSGGELVVVWKKLWFFCGLVDKNFDAFGVETLAFFCWNKAWGKRLWTCNISS